MSCLSIPILLAPFVLSARRGFAAAAPRRGGCGAAHAGNVATRDAAASPGRLGHFRMEFSRMPSQLPPDVAGVLVPPLGTFAEGSAPYGEIMRLQSDHSRITVGSQSGHSRVTVGSQSGHRFLYDFATRRRKNNLILINYTTAIPKSQNHKETYDPTVTRL